MQLCVSQSYQQSMKAWKPAGCGPELYMISHLFSTSQQYIDILSNDIINSINVIWTRISGKKWLDGLTNYKLFKFVWVFAKIDICPLSRWASYFHQKKHQTASFLHSQSATTIPPLVYCRISPPELKAFCEQSDLSAFKDFNKTW